MGSILSGNIMANENNTHFDTKEEKIRSRTDVEPKS